VLELIAQGMPNKAVARRLDIAMRTVEDRRRRVMSKIGADSFADLMMTYAEYQKHRAEADADMPSTYGDPQQKCG
ncbi:MAG: helix-turn-helix transcriptional regulator, partial [Planctomycetales bacterium]|nr:helix-turn-helix transcriptional regulator [Planctomycetales bacterium]